MLREPWGFWIYMSACEPRHSPEIFKHGVSLTLYTKETQRNRCLKEQDYFHAPGRRARHVEVDLHGIHIFICQVLSTLSVLEVLLYPFTQDPASCASNLLSLGPHGSQRRVEGGERAPGIRRSGVIASGTWRRGAVGGHGLNEEMW